MPPNAKGHAMRPGAGNAGGRWTVCHPWLFRPGRAAPTRLLRLGVEATGASRSHGGVHWGAATPPDARRMQQAPGGGAAQTLSLRGHGPRVDAARRRLLVRSVLAWVLLYPTLAFRWRVGVNRRRLLATFDFSGARE